MQRSFAPYINTELSGIRKGLRDGLDIIEKVGEINEVTQQCREYFSSLQSAMDQTTSSKEPQLQTDDDIQAIQSELPSAMAIESSIQTQAFQPQPQMTRLGADLSASAGDWNDIYGAADIFKDPLLPEFGFNWLDM
jgi:hypothetical protein